MKTEHLYYLVTGGAGFIGSHLVDRLLADGHAVIVIDDFSSGREENLVQHHDNKNLTIVHCSINEPLDDLFLGEKIDAVFHLAAIPRVQYSIQFPAETHHANVNGTFNLLEMCRRHGVKRFVFSSSSSVYGDQPTLPKVETMIPDPISPYALHKLIGEQYCGVYHTIFGLETIALRYFNVYGVRQNPEGDYACLIPKFIKMISQGVAPRINGDGLQTRDFTAVADVVVANLAAATIINPAAFGQVYNIGGGRNYSVNEVTAAIMALTGKTVEPIHGSAVIEPHDSLADVSKAKQLLSWEPQLALMDGLAKLWQSLNT